MPRKTMRPVDGQPASVGGSVDDSTVATVPILEQLQTPDASVPTDKILLAQGVWPWSALHAQNVPERWLTMEPDVIGVIAQIVVQTPNGPSLLSVDQNGRINTEVDNVNQIVSPVATYPGDVALSRRTRTFFNLSVGAGGTTVLVPGVGQYIAHVWEMLLFINSVAAAEIHLQDTSGNDLDLWTTDVTGKILIPENGKSGFAGAGLQLHNASGVASGFMAGHIDWTQSIP